MHAQLRPPSSYTQDWITCKVFHSFLWFSMRSTPDRSNNHNRPQSSLLEFPCNSPLLTEQRHTHNVAPVSHTHTTAPSVKSSLDNCAHGDDLCMCVFVLIPFMASCAHPSVCVGVWAHWKAGPVKVHLSPCCVIYYLFFFFMWCPMTPWFLFLKVSETQLSANVTNVIKYKITEPCKNFHTPTFYHLTTAKFNFFCWILCLSERQKNISLYKHNWENKFCMIFIFR